VKGVGGNIDIPMTIGMLTGTKADERRGKGIDSPVSGWMLLRSAYFIVHNYSSEMSLVSSPLLCFSKVSLNSLRVSSE